MKDMCTMCATVDVEYIVEMYLFCFCSLNVPLHTWQLFSLAKLTTTLSCRHPKPARQNIVHQNIMILTIFLWGLNPTKTVMVPTDIVFDNM